MSSKQISLCDEFIYIAQYGAGTASLNVSTAAAIVLHHFALWAAYPEQGRHGQKFIVAEKDVKAHATGTTVLVSKAMRSALEWEHNTHSASESSRDYNITVLVVLGWHQCCII